MRNRRNFIKNVSLGTIGLSLISNSVLANEKIKKITILHTNDMHSHIEPFKSGKYKGLGGMAQRATIVNEIREKEKNVPNLSSRNFGNNSISKNILRIYRM